MKKYIIAVQISKIINSMYTLSWKHNDTRVFVMLKAIEIAFRPY